MDWKAVVDRFEGKMAILLVGEEEVAVEIPINLLPTETKEGDYLQASWQIDQQSTQEAKERVTSLLERLINKSPDDH